ncbi:dihydrofolate reductase [Lewinella cohaerens]|uniref:dihydrofolate reductase n=1 Tax=Lewinella cohaerens TaxID=70995 RepID=UPI00036CF819|nr:dihydrofolate reductase [Lewinella cohaerens]
MIVSAIVAAAQNNVIGDGNDIPWRISSDLKYFKRTTLDHHVIMGRKTFASMGRPLPKRTNVVLTRDLMFTATGILVAHSIEEALTIAYDNDETEVFIIGGGEIYKQSMHYVDKVYLTRVSAAPEGEVVFPDLPEAEWELISSEPHQAGERDEHDFVFEVYTRRKN